MLTVMLSRQHKTPKIKWKLKQTNKYQKAGRPKRTNKQKRKTRRRFFLVKHGYILQQTYITFNKFL